MRNTFFYVKIFCIAVLCSIPAALGQEQGAVPQQAVKAQETEKSQPKLLDILPPQDIFYFDYIFQPMNKVRDYNNLEMDLNEFRVGIDPMFPIGNEGLYGGIGVTYNAYDFYFEESRYGWGGLLWDRIIWTDRRSFHAITFPITLAWIADDWMILGRLEPGIKSDCRGFNRHDMQVNGSIVGAYLFHPNFVLQAGIGLTNDFGDLVPVPILGCEWKMIPNTLDLSIFAPFSAKLTWHVMPDNTEGANLFLSYELDGDQFHFRYRDDAGNVKEDDGQFTFYRLGGGFEYALMPGVITKIFLGGTAGGEYEFKQFGNKEKGKFDGAFVFMVSLTINENVFK
jgi:hypothetical protein